MGLQQTGSTYCGHPLYYQHSIEPSWTPLESFWSPLSILNLSTVASVWCECVHHRKCYRVTHLNISAKWSQIFTKTLGNVRIGLLTSFWTPITLIGMIQIFRLSEGGADMNLTLSGHKNFKFHQTKIMSIFWDQFVNRNCLRLVWIVTFAMYNLVQYIYIYIIFEYCLSDVRL